MSEFEEPSDVERLQIAQHFMLNAPPGQFKDVTIDVKKLLPDNLMDEPLEMGIARAYNLKNNKIVKSPSGASVVVCSFGELDDTHYLDPTDGNTFSVDHITLETTVSSREPEWDSSLESKRKVLQETLAKYVSKCFDSSNSTCGVYTKDGKFNLVITGEKSNLRNFWSGKWSSSWSLESSGSATTLQGEIKIHAHYFEDGNVQLQTTKPAAAMKWDWAFGEDNAQTVIDYINAQETALHTALGYMYLNMDAETFKSIRRILPVTKLKMDWNLNSVKLHSTLSANSTLTAK